MIAIVPGYISRSVAGSYDNEGIAIFCMLLTYYFWIKAVNTGTILWATMTALAYFYMVSSLFNNRGTAFRRPIYRLIYRAGIVKSRELLEFILNYVYIK